MLTTNRAHRVHDLRLLPAALVIAMAVTGCATRGGVPRPFPGAALPPAADPATSPPAGEPVPPPPPRTAEVPELRAPISTLLATAMSFQGTPYRYGGSDPSGFDCSGFVQWVYAQHGRALPREVREQYGIGQDIDPDDVQPGDLVFFETVSRGASHVGIALGGGEFIHAPSSRGVVRVERYDTSSYWAPRWVGARRVVDAE